MLQDQNSRLADDNGALRSKMNDFEVQNRDLERKLIMARPNPADLVPTVLERSMHSNLGQSYENRNISNVSNSYSPLRKDRTTSHERTLNANRSGFQSTGKRSNISPDLGDQGYRKSQSPLRRSRSPIRSPPNIQETSDTHQRMRKSQERIAAILGLNERGGSRPAVSNRAPQQSITELLASRRGEQQATTSAYGEERVNPHHTSGTSPLRTLSADKPAYTQGTDPSSNTPFASSMVRQSLADLKTRLNLMRQEKQQV